MDRSHLIDELEAVLFAHPQVICPLNHLFTPGMYIRTIFMPAGTMHTSVIHNTTHPYVVTKGKVNVEINGQIEAITAPYYGITYPGTRRVLYIMEDCVWTTYHPLPIITGEENDWSEEEKNKLISTILDTVTEPHENPLLCDEVKKYLTKKKEGQICQWESFQPQ